VRARTQQCQKGAVTCVQSVQTAPESATRSTDDCNGMVDEGDGLCPTGKVCDLGRCVPKCGTAEFRCATGSVCSSHGVCVRRPAPTSLPCRSGV